MSARSYHIRLARVHELPAIRAVERAAGARFREAGLPAIAEMEPVPLEQLRAAQRQGWLWVAADVRGQPVGFALVEVIRELPHLAELSVHPAHGRQGLGRRLVEIVCDWARSQGYRALTLATFRDVPWNAPFYIRLGFRVLDEAELSPQLRQLREHEAQAGLPVEQRVLMRREL